MIWPLAAPTPAALTCRPRQAVAASPDRRALTCGCVVLQRGEPVRRARSGDAPAKLRLHHLGDAMAAAT